MSKVNAAKAMLDVMLKWGITRVYGLPGDSIDTTVEALNDYKDKIQFVQVRHEEVASLAATYESQLTGQICACLSIGGPGAIHLLNGLYDAKMNGVPVLALMGQVRSNALNTDYFQEIDTPSMCEDVAVYNKLITSAKTLPAIVDEAIRTAIKERGVAVLTIPDDIPEADIPAPAANVAGPGAILNPPAIPATTVEAMATMLKEAKRPIVLAGTGVKAAQAELATFIEQNHLPIVQTVPAKGRVADDHPNSLGNVGRLGTKPAYEAMKEADLIFMLGTNYPFRDYLPVEGSCKCIQVDINPSRFGKRFPVDLAVHGTVKDALAALNAKGAIHTCDKFLRCCQHTMQHWNQWMEAERTRKGDHIHPAFLMSCIEKMATSDAIFSVDVGTSTSWTARFLRVQPTQDYIISAWLATMGCGLPGAIGAKLSYPHRQVISISGDGAMAMVMQDLVTAHKYKLPMVQFVLNNQKLAFIEYEQQSAGQRNYEIDLADIDFAKVAEACGCKGYSVRTPEELEKLLPTLTNVTEPTLVNVYVLDDAPLPGKIVWDEAMGFSKFLIQTIYKDHKIPDMPPLTEAIRQFF